MISWLVSRVIFFLFKKHTTVNLLFSKIKLQISVHYETHKRKIWSKTMKLHWESWNKKKKLRFFFHTWTKKPPTFWRVFLQEFKVKELWVIHLVRTQNFGKLSPLPHFVRYFGTPSLLHKYASKTLWMTSPLHHIIFNNYYLYHVISKSYISVLCEFLGESLGANLLGLQELRLFFKVGISIAKCLNKTVLSFLTFHNSNGIYQHFVR